MPFFRASGVLLHPTSLPSRFGIGDLGLEAYQFIDFLVATDQQLWQVLPIGPTGYGNSPYMSYSAMAGNPLLISPEQLKEQQLLTAEDLDSFPNLPAHPVDFDRVIAHKMPLYTKAFANFQQHQSPIPQKEFAGFCATKSHWLEDYAVFMALKEHFQGVSWSSWDDDIATRQPEAIAHYQGLLSDRILFHKYLQFAFFQQWSELKQYANLRGIEIIGDIPIYVAHDSADVWSHPDLFCLDEATREPALMAGVPPDYFSATGQLWGNPVYHWEALKKQNFAWWVERFESLLDYVDIIRIDHFRGFQAYWAVPIGEKTAIYGEWLEAPGAELFTVIAQKLGKLPILAEDLGIITDEVIALRDQFEFPGMKVLHFAFNSGTDNAFLPFNYVHNCVVYTGTHDNDTTIGWFEKLSDEQKGDVWRHMGFISPWGIHWDLIRLAMGSIANQVIIPLQDILGLDGYARMNYPSTPEGNWAWRYWEGALTEELSDRLKTMTQTFGRSPRVK